MTHPHHSYRPPVLKNDDTERVVLALDQVPAATAPQLAAHTGIALGRVYAILARLSVRHLVARTPTTLEADPHYSLTEAGRSTAYIWRKPDTPTPEGHPRE
jgi:DNA-binding MarR family transcriptional regulator